MTGEREPCITATITGELSESWRQWTASDGRVEVSMAAHPGVEPGAEALLVYYGAVEGDTATAFDTTLVDLERDGDDSYTLTWAPGRDFTQAIEAGDTDAE